MSQDARPGELWALVEDLFFRAKVEGLVAPLDRRVAFYRDADSLVRSLGVAAPPPSLIVVELGSRPAEGFALLAALRLVPAPPPTLAFYSHVEDDLRRRALELGVSRIVPRSAFVRRFGELFLELTAAPGAG